MKTLIFSFLIGFLCISIGKFSELPSRLHGLKKQGVCEHNARMMGLNNNQMLFEARLHGLNKAGGLGGAQPPPHLQAQYSHGSGFRGKVFRV